MVNTAKFKRQSLERYCASYADLQVALSALTFLFECDQHAKYSIPELRRFRCYETTFVVSYARPFTSNRGNTIKQISLRKIGVSLNEVEKKMHEKIIKLRNSFYAHSDLDYLSLRLDGFDIEVDDYKKIFLIHSRFDEGLQFYDLFDRVDAESLISKIMSQLYIHMKEISEQNRDFLPIIVVPSS